MPKNYIVVADVFADNRPGSEKEGKLYGKDGYATSKDQMFKKDLPLQISQMFVDHLSKAKIFKKIDLLDISNDLDLKQEEMTSLKNKGYNLAIIGKINHFYGYQSDEAATAVAPLFGLVGVLTEAMINPKTVGAKVEYGDVKIIDLDNQKIVWSGNAGHDFEQQVKLYDGPVIYVLRALKETNNKFSRQLAENSF
ncbi:MAG: hypothetical protein HQL24_10180 [Candidatus Omnitrophica bacterium]|nr:hypothetical protein [Candidatus Omnitrophota bacterium]